jgi:hypothetical protein
MSGFVKLPASDGLVLPKAFGDAFVPLISNRDAMFPFDEEPEVRKALWNAADYRPHLLVLP